MQWVDQENYVGPCRRVTRRGTLHHRRRVNKAEPSPPQLHTLLAEALQARELGCDVLKSRRVQQRVCAGIDLAARLGDQRSRVVFETLNAAALACADRSDH